MRFDNLIVEWEDWNNYCEKCARLIQRYYHEIPPCKLTVFCKIGPCVVKNKA